MKTAIFQFASGSIHFATSLEILKDNSLAGSEMSYCLWGSKTKYPGRMSIGYESFSGKPPKVIEKLIKHSDMNVDFTSEIIFDHEWVLLMTEKFIDLISDASSISLLKNIDIAGIKPGAALANEITTLTKNRDIDLSMNTSLVRVLVESYFQVYSAVTNYIAKNKIDRIFLFNGRFLHERSVWDAGRAQGVQVMLFETTRNRYFLREEGFHSRKNNQKVMLEHWENSDLCLDKRLEIGAKYFLELRSRLRPFFTETKEDFRIDKPYFVYFSSSDDEAVGFWEEWEEPLGEQLDCIRKLQKIFDDQKEFELIIRLHPNLKNKSDSQKGGWLTIANSRSTKIVGPEQEISSYELLDNSVASITFGSTIGLESAFALKPSLVLADCGYDLLGVVDKAESWTDVSNWIFLDHKISNEELINRKNNACIRGFFIATAGITFKYTTLVDVGLGAWNATMFDGVKMGSNLVIDKYRKIISRIKFKRIIALMQD
jgi:hypothetical protein